MTELDTTQVVNQAKKLDSKYQYVIGVEDDGFLLSDSTYKSNNVVVEAEQYLRDGYGQLIIYQLVPVYRTTIKLESI